MATVTTMSGEIDINELGVTYMHEHIFIISPEMQHYWPGYQGWIEDEQVELAQKTLRTLHESYGVQTILDPTVPGLGRNIRAMARAIEGIGLNVIAATGWYTYTELPFAFHFKDMEGRTAELLRLFIKDIDEGLEGTSIKPGVIKCTTDSNGVTPDIEAILRASARAHLKTGLPITTHSDYPKKTGLMQQEIFRQEGVDMGAVVIGHCNESNDLDYLEQLIANGTYIGFDRCGMERPQTTNDWQVKNLVELCRRGYADRIVLSHDHVVFQDLIPHDHLVNSLSGYPYGHIYK